MVAVSVVKKILITGGAGFIGSRVAKALLDKGCEVKILDNFSPQVHANKSLGETIAGKVQLFEGDIRDKSLLELALKDSEVVIHLAAETGTGQSMYEISHYFDVNVQATANLIDLVQNNSCASKLSSLIVASSRAVYGEGAYYCESHGTVYPSERNSILMKEGRFEPVCPLCGNSVILEAITEGAPFSPMSIYGLTKQIQEQSVLMAARARGINGFGLRYQNVFGPGQSLKNPYTGIMAIFANLARQGQVIDIYEDGAESRDFVYVDDVVESTVRAALYPGQYVGAINVGSGVATSVRQVAEKIIKYFNSSSSLEISGRFRVGDIRHNIANLSELDRVLGFVPRIGFDEGINRFLEWVESQPLEDQYAYQRASNLLEKKGLMQISRDSK